MTSERTNFAAPDEALPPFHWVANEAAWRACLAALRAVPRLAIDLEANSMYALSLIHISPTCGAATPSGGG